MKNTLLSITLLAMGYMASAQSRAIRDFHEKFRQTEKYVSLHINGGLLKFLSEIDTGDTDTEALLNAISKIDAIDLHSISRMDVDFNEKDVDQLRRSIHRERFDDLMKVRDGSAKVDFLIKEQNGKISDLLMIINDLDDFVLLSFSGDIDLAALARLSRELDIKGAEHLDKIGKKFN